ncbi:MAG: DDE-type integrase/transposase/recombinase [Candidatus Dormibacteria bacterium]
MDDRRRDIGLFRYSLIREAADARLSHRERGELVRALAATDHVGPRGDRVRVSRPTLDRWIRGYRGGGFEALVPVRRRVTPRTAAELLELAVRLHTEAPRRSAAHIAIIVAEQTGIRLSERTVQRHFARRGLVRGDSSPRRAFGRFEATQPNELWTGDALHGHQVAGEKTYLFAFIDDHSRTLTGYRWGLAEDTVRLEVALRNGLAARGVPHNLYLDNGSPMVNVQLLRACACMGIRLVHSRPGQPAGRGKIERVFGTIRRQFLVEIEHRGVADLAELNRLFVAWVEGVYHRTVHSETGQAPLERFLAAGALALPTPQALREAFLWSEKRRVTKTATVSLHGNVYEVDSALVGQLVELVFDPFDLTDVEVRFQDRPMGRGAPQHIGRHVRHPQARTEGMPPPPPTGIDYLGLITARYEAATRRRIAYADLPLPDPPSEEEQP